MSNPIPLPTAPATVIDVLVRDANGRVQDRERYVRLDEKSQRYRGKPWQSLDDGLAWDTSDLDLDHNTFEVVSVPVAQKVSS